MGDRTWTFRGDSELDPILKRWSKQSEKSFHVRQALRSYIHGSTFIQARFESEQVEVERGEVEMNFDEWG
jgi:predicted transcriptional regulator